MSSEQFPFKRGDVLQAKSGVPLSDHTLVVPLSDHTLVVLESPLSIHLDPHYKVLDPRYKVLDLILTPQRDGSFAFPKNHTRQPLADTLTEHLYKHVCSLDLPLGDIDPTSLHIGFPFLLKFYKIRY